MKDKFGLIRIKSLYDLYNPIYNNVSLFYSHAENNNNRFFGTKPHL